MNYRHVYHAGNFADVTKHLGLLCLLERMLGKEKPFCVMESHAGRGRYDLESAEARRSKEADTGIGRLTRQRNLPHAVRALLAIVRQAQADPGRLRYYPGSPEIITRRLRSGDRAVFCELQPGEAGLLRDRYASDARVAVHQRDGYEAIKALLPPTPRRGFVFIDPPFEQPDEYETLLCALDAGLRRWPGGIFVVWYPIKDTRDLRRFRRRLDNGSSPAMTAEFTVRRADHAGRLNGSGLAFVQPPWRFDQSLAPLWSRLPELLGEDGGASAEIRWLRPQPDGTVRNDRGRRRRGGSSTGATGRHA